jgi:hypothetical protein
VLYSLETDPVASTSDMNPAFPSSDGTCHLFRLPAELRNIIYEYTLSAPNGVVCRATNYTGHILYHFYKAKEVEVFMDRQYQRRSEPLQAVKTELNQLKYTCRQLNAETKLLTTSLNEVIFYNVVPNAISDRTVDCRNDIWPIVRVSKGVEDFIDYMSIVSNRKLKCPPKVTIIVTNKYSPDNFFNFCEPATCAALLKICRQYPELVVKLRHCWLDVCEVNFFEKAIGLMVHLRKDHSSMERLRTHSTHTSKRQILSSWRDVELDLDPVKGYPPNLRVFPRFARFDSDAYRDGVEKSVSNGAAWWVSVNWVRGGINGAVTLIEEIIEHGI